MSHYHPEHSPVTNFGAHFLNRRFNFRVKLKFCQLEYARFSIGRYISARRSFFAFLSS